MNSIMNYGFGNFKFQEIKFNIRKVWQMSANIHDFPFSEILNIREMSDFGHRSSSRLSVKIDLVFLLKAFFRNH